MCTILWSLSFTAASLYEKCTLKDIKSNLDWYYSDDQL